VGKVRRHQSQRQVWIVLCAGGGLEEVGGDEGDGRMWIG